MPQPQPPLLPGNGEANINLHPTWITPIAAMLELGKKAPINIDLHPTWIRRNPLLLLLPSTSHPTSSNQTTALSLVINLETVLAALHERIHVACKKHHRTINRNLFARP